MFEILRNMLRRKSRTFLTVFGIVIGIFALLVMGSMAEKMNLLLAGGVKYYTGQITLSAKGSMSGVGGGIMDAKELKRVEKVPGVLSVTRSVSMMLDDDQSSINFGVPPMVMGFEAGKGMGNRNYKTLAVDSGRSLVQGDHGVVLMGCDLAKAKGLGVGDTFIIKKRPFRVIGILAKTLTAPDKEAMVPLADAQSLFVAASPMMKRMAAAFPIDSVVTGASVVWRDGVDAEKLAKTLAHDFPGMQISAPAAMKKQFSQAMLMFNLIVTGSALIALVVGGLSVINTMTMSVSERTKEIGLKKALGARTADILREYLTEAGLIGLLGGLIGAALGGAFVAAVNGQMAAKGADIFLVTPRLALISLGFATALGALSGIYPALRAARLDCVTALKAE